MTEPTTRTPANATRVLDALARLPFGVAAELTSDAILQRGVTMIGYTPSMEARVPAGSRTPSHV